MTSGNLERTLNSLPLCPATFKEPMECLAVPKLPDGSNWLFEIKLDGYRAIRKTVCRSVGTAIQSAIGQVNHPVFRSQHNGGARGKGQAIQSDVRRNHGWRRVLVEVTPPQPFQRRPLGLRPSHEQLVS